MGVLADGDREAEVQRLENALGRLIDNLGTARHEGVELRESQENTDVKRDAVGDKAPSLDVERANAAAQSPSKGPSEIDISKPVTFDAKDPRLVNLSPD